MVQYYGGHSIHTHTYTIAESSREYNNKKKIENWMRKKNSVKKNFQFSNAHTHMENGRRRLMVMMMVMTIKHYLMFSNYDDEWMIVWMIKQ